jgi:lipopolysaccharide transport system ATP-binding protein
MSNLSVKISNISKAYRIGINVRENDTLIGNILSGLKSPFSNFKKLKSLSNINEDDKSEDIIWALKDVSADIKHGEVLGIIGKNGAGKSTLLKIVSNITEPTSGKIEIFGRVASLLEVGTGFNPELTGRENVYLNGTILGMTRKEVNTKFDEIVSFAGVEKFIDTPVKRYSSGMKVRLAFAVAAHLEPEILIVDEVLAVGDAEFQKKCLGKMESITSEGRTILFVSHNMSAIKNLCTRAILLNGGKVIKEGDTSEVINEYLTGTNESFNGGVIPKDFKRISRNKDQVYFEKILLVDKNENPVDYFSYHQELYVQFEINALKDIEDAIIVMLINSVNNEKLSFSSSNDYKNRLFSFKKGIHKITLKVLQNFLPGRYFVTFSLVDREGHPFDRLNSILSFNVGTMRESDGSYYRWGKVLGEVNTLTEWEFPSDFIIKEF